MKGLAILFTATVVTISAATAPLYAQGPRETISVRGHWVMEVRNPDGTIAARREFDNAMSPFALFIVQELFTRNGALGAYSILLRSGSQTSPFGNNAGRDEDQPVAARITEPTNFYGGSDDLSFRTMLPPERVLNQAAFRLAGTATATEGGWITEVQTGVNLCGGSAQAPGATSPHECAADSARVGSSWPFTGTTIAPLRLEAGQVIDVKVTIGFAAAPHPPS
jgi:hypothetical protein